MSSAMPEDGHPTHPDDDRPAPLAAPAAPKAANRRLYNPLTLLAYDAYVIGLSHKVFWGIDNGTIHDLYDQGMGRVHLDVGVGTGYFPAAALKRKRADLHGRRVELLDNAPAALGRTARRLRRRLPEAVDTHQASALDRWPLAEDSVESVGSTMMLHCLPGHGFANKKKVFTEAARVLAPGGFFYGCSILGEADPAPISRPGARMRRFYNERRDTLHNGADTEADLRQQLTAAFGETAKVEVGNEGAVALWQVQAA